MRKAYNPVVTGTLLAVLSFALYLPTVNNGFIGLDDDRYIYKNPEILHGLSWRTTLWALRTTEHANWYPLQRLSHLVDVSLFGAWAGGHHLVSAAWHAAASVMLFAALRLMTGSSWRALAVAALFAVHPLQVEAVAWAAERGSVLSGFFFSLTLLLWTRYVRQPGPGRYVAVLLGFGMGLACKPTGAVLPFVLLLLDWWPLGRATFPGEVPWRSPWPRFRRLVLEKVPLLALSGVFLSVAVIVHREHRALNYLDLTLGLRAGNAAISSWRYVGKLLLPVNLAVYYPHPGAGLRASLAVVAALALAAVTLTLLLLSRRRPWLGVGWLWFLGMLAPMIGIVQFGAHAMADRFAYLPLAGFFLALVWFLAGDLPRPRYRPMLLAAGAAAVLVIFGGATVRYLHIWRDSETLFKHTLAVTRGNWLIHNNLCGTLKDAGRMKEAIPQCVEALRLHPDYADAHHNLGVALAKTGRFDEGIAHFQEALRLQPGNTVYRTNLNVARSLAAREKDRNCSR